MFHCHDLEKKIEIMNLKPLSINYMCVYVIIDFSIHLYFLFIIILLL